MQINKLLKITLGFFLLFQMKLAAGQEFGFISGVVKDSMTNDLIDLVDISVPGQNFFSRTDYNGRFKLKVPANQKHKLMIVRTGYETKTYFVELKPGEIKELIVILKSRSDLPTVEIIDNYNRPEPIIRLNPKLINSIPDVSGGGVFSLLKTLGATSRNELSSQYTVRGGNFDENLVYVNDIEIFRPFLIRSGQQEGLPFVNSDMIASVSFSPGGFDATYGDKMSSVLDVKYKIPMKNAGSVSASILGTNAHIEGLSKNKKFSFISAFRYKTTKYLLNSLETQGDYKPDYKDFQTYLTYKVNDKFELGLLGNYAQNKYEFVPRSRQTDFGTLSSAVSIFVNFEGEELDKYSTLSFGLSATYKPNEKTELKLVGSAYHSIEQETFDIEASYNLNLLDTRIGQETSGDSILNLGIGKYLEHARNYLTSNVYNILFKGQHKSNSHHWTWGAKYQQELIEDNLNEWKYIDSAGYSTPHPFEIPYSKSDLKLNFAMNSENVVNSERLSAFLQDGIKINGIWASYFFKIGSRVSYWSFNKELLVSPRFLASIKPAWKTDILFRFSTGSYYQSPFYREFRDSVGLINPKIKSQHSWQWVLGTDYNFHAWNRPFKLVAEIYYKAYDQLTPYEVDNVRVRYFANSKAVGYATGLDIRVNGEFVPGIDSWTCFSLLKTMENIEGDGAGYLPRPSDQILNVGMFFQDYLPGNKSYQMRLSFQFSSGYPFGPPNVGREYASFRMPSYKRVDIGFTKIFKEIDTEIGTKIKILKPFTSVQLSAEIFNLLGANNTISYYWLTVVQNQSLGFDAESIANQYATPNRLTGRLFNLRLTMKF